MTTQLLSSMGGQSLGSGGNPASGDDQGGSGPGNSNAEGSSPQQEGAPQNMSQETVYALGSTGFLQILNGGVHLPDDMPNGGQDADNPNSQSR